MQLKKIAILLLVSERGKPLMETKKKTNYGLRTVLHKSKLLLQGDWPFTIPGQGGNVTLNWIGSSVLRTLQSIPRHGDV
jgi:hypothetical protein